MICGLHQESLDVTVTRHREELDDIMELLLIETANADQKVLHVVNCVQF